MAHLVPPDYPHATSRGEALVFDALRSTETAPGWTVMHSLHLPEHVRQVEGEADFVILMPKLGVLCVEVKGHSRAKYVNGAWYLGGNAAPDYRGPFRQAEMAARSVKKKVTSALPAATGVLFWPAVIFTHCAPALRGPAGDWHTWQLITSDDLAREPLDEQLEAVMRRARDHVSSTAHARWFDATSPSKADCGKIRRVLRPDVHFLPAVTTVREQRAEEIRRFTDEQLEIIEGLDGVNDRTLVEGPAGTGKTVLALEEVRRASSLDIPTALICFNQQLSKFLRAEAESLGIRGVEISTMHSLMRRIAGECSAATQAHPAGERYWTQDLPNLALSVLIDQRPRFKMLVIDEAQDLAEDAYLDVMDALLDGELAGGSWRMFGDFERQAIYTAEPAKAINRLTTRADDVTRYRLRRNCRNTPRVAEYVVRLGGLSPAYTRVLRPDRGSDGTPRTSFYSARTHQHELLRKTIADLLAIGELSAEDIVVLSPTVDSCARQLADSGTGPRLVQLPARHDGACSFGTVSAFKGLEAPAVILTDIEEVGTARSQRLFYVGVSRATDHLRVIARNGLQHDVARLVREGAGNGQLP